MHQSEYEASVGAQVPAIGLGLWYDAERLILEGIYLDEVSAYRARRSWIKTFELNFLLEEIHDFKVKVVFDRDEGRYHVQCTFTSACGRYAFWRLTHHQAPEVQFTLETAHLPHMTSVRFLDAEVEPESDLFVAQTDQVEGSDVDEAKLGFLGEALRFTRRKARTCYRVARSFVFRLGS
ncbi:MAG: hypothetical protein RIS36_480 [Pseudomonadota bacterium]|jgi:hypothetical protein